MAKCTLYVQVEPIWSSWKKRPDGEPELEEIKPVRMTQRRSASPKPGTVEVKLTLEIPNGAFYPLRPEAVIVVPEEMLRTNIPMEVTATENGDADAPAAAS